MQCNGMVLGVERITGTKDGKDYDFTKVNILDPDDTKGRPLSLSLPKDHPELSEQFASLRGKSVPMRIVVDGKYAQFIDFIK